MARIIRANIVLKLLPLEFLKRLDGEHNIRPDDPRHVVAAASQLLSDLTHFAGIVVTPRRRGVGLKHVEFMQLSEKRVLLILVAADGDVQNRILVTEKIYSPSANRGGKLHQPALRRLRIRSIARKSEDRTVATTP